MVPRHFRAAARGLRCPPQKPSGERYPVPLPPRELGRELAHAGATELERDADSVQASGLDNAQAPAVAGCMRADPGWYQGWRDVGGRSPRTGSLAR